MTTRDLPPSANEETDVFDEALNQAVRRFQERHGLDVDGVVGPKALEELNVPVEDRIRQIVLNLERWRWLPQDLGREYIIVNIANIGLEVVKEGQTVLSMKVVIGKEFRRTPVFSAKVTYLVFNPYWNIPKKIAVQDKLPLIKKDWSYLEKQKIRVFQGWGAEYVLQPDPTWTKEKVLSMLERSHDQAVTLPRSLPVHLQYLTAWVDDDGTVQFRKDIYGLDKRLNAALRERAPSFLSKQQISHHFP